MQLKVNKIKDLMNSKEKSIKITQTNRKKTPKSNRQNRRKKKHPKTGFFYQPNRKLIIKLIRKLIRKLLRKPVNKPKVTPIMKLLEIQSKRKFSTDPRIIFENQFHDKLGLGKVSVSEQLDFIDKMNSSINKNNIEKPLENYSILDYLSRILTEKSSLVNEPLMDIFTIDNTTKKCDCRQICNNYKTLGLMGQIKKFLMKLGVSAKYIKTLKHRKITGNLYFDYLANVIIEMKSNRVSLDDQIKSIDNNFQNPVEPKIIKKPIIKKEIKSYRQTKIVTKSTSTLRRALIKYQTKIYNMVKDLHYKVALWLVKNFSIIYMGKFSTDKMLASKSNRGKIYRIYSTLNHHMLFIRLKRMADKYGSNVVFINEYLTTRTCSNCGYDHDKIGSNKTFLCPKCGMLAERDANAAKNILKKGLISATKS